MRWAQIALNDASWRFISLTDGKQPLFIWGSMFLMKFISDPLIAGRIMSVFSGLTILIGLWFLSFELFKNKRVAFLTSLLYVFYPFAQVYDRMAMMDSMVGAFAVWALYFTVLLVRKVRLDLAYTLGFIIGGGILTKTSDFFSIYLLPFTLLLFNFKNKFFSKKLFKLILFFAVACVIATALYNVLRLSPFFSTISTKNAVFVYPFSEWIKHPFAFLSGNLNGLINWTVSYLGPYLILVLFSLLSYKKFGKEKVLLFLYFILPFVALALFGKVIFPRFIFFMTLFLLPLASVALYDMMIFASSKFRNSGSYIGAFILVLFLIYPSFSIYKILTDPLNSPIADADNGQYLNNWTAGWAVDDTINFLKRESVNQKIFVGTEGTFGLMPYSLELYLIQNKNIIIKGYWPVGDQLPEEAMKYATEIPSYFIFYQPQHQIISSDLPVGLVYQKKQGNSPYLYRIYKIIPNK